MKMTIKQWCSEQGINWLGQGTIGAIRYDWKLVLGKGRTAIFSSTVEGELPEVRRIGKREILVFPNVNRPRDGGKISQAAFQRMINWIENCLDGKPHKLETPNKSP